MAERHPVADLLTNEMRERVRTAKFYRDDTPDREWSASVVATIDDRTCCPLGIALGGGSHFWDRFPASTDFLDFCRVTGRDKVAAVNVIQDFMNLVDSDLIENPADVYVMLGCEPPAAAGREP